MLYDTALTKAKNQVKQPTHQPRKRTDRRRFSRQSLSKAMWRREKIMLPMMNGDGCPSDRSFRQSAIPPVPLVPSYRACPCPNTTPTLSSTPPHPLWRNSPHPTAKGYTPLGKKGVPLQAKRVYPFKHKEYTPLVEKGIPLLTQGVYPFSGKEYTLFAPRCRGFGWRGWGIWVERVGDLGGEGGAFRRRGSGAERQRLAIIR